MLRPISARPRLADRAGRPQGRRRPLISLTPLIDVVFILLVFFMLASSFLDWRSIDLNAPAQAAAGPALEGALLVEIHPDRLLLSGEVVSLDLLTSRIAERVEAKPDQRVVVKSAAGVPLQNAVNVLDRLTEAGVAQLSLTRDRGR